MLEEKSKELLKYLEESVEIVTKMGLKVTDFRSRYAKLTMPIEQNRNHIGTMYAGSLFTLGEMAGGAIFLASFDYENFYPIVKELTIRYRRPATTDMTVEVEMAAPQVERLQKAVEGNGKVDWDMNLELKDEGGEACCFVHGIWQMRKRDR